MRILWVAALTAISVLAGSIGSGTAAAQSACTDLGGVVEDQICRGHSENAAYTMDFSFPVDYPDQQALTGYLTQTRDGFVNVSETSGSRDMPYVLDAKGTAYRSGLPLIGTQSVVFEVYENVGGAFPQTFYKAFNYDLGKKTPIGYDTLFKPGSRPLDIVFPIVARELEKQIGLDSPVLPGEGRNPANYQHFALTDDAVIFFFGRGELTAGAAGAMQAAVPRAALAPVLA